MADTIRDSARKAIQSLHGMGVNTAMLTGDNRRTAEAVARALEMDTVIAEVLPEDKSKQIEQLQHEGRRVAMVGDGVNDAPALAKAEVGIAIGAGTDVAVETAGVVLGKNNPADVAGSIRLARAVPARSSRICSGRRSTTSWPSPSRRAPSTLAWASPCCCAAPPSR